MKYSLPIPCLKLSLQLLLLLMSVCTTYVSADQNLARDVSPWSVSTGNAYITLNNDFIANIHGATADGQYSISITRSRGILTQGQRATTIIVNAMIPRTSDYSVYNFIGSDSGGLITGRAYCNSAGQLTDVWIEDSSSTSGLQKTHATGACNITKSSSANDLYQVTDENLLITPPATYPSIQGSQISLAPNDVGSIILNQNYSLLPYSVIDCKACGNTASAGWVEIHSILSHASSVSDICMGILYLYVQQGPVMLSWLNCFEPQQPNGTFNATYDIGNFNANISGTVVVGTTTGTASTSSAAIPTTTAINQTQLDPNSNGLSMGAKIGIGIGVPVIIIALVTAMFLVFRHRRHGRQHHPELEGKRSEIYKLPNKESANTTSAELDHDHPTEKVKELDSSGPQTSKRTAELGDNETASRSELQ